MRGSYLGPHFSAEEIRQQLDAYDAVYSEMDDAELIPRLAEILEQENVVGWFQGRMEFGPRALGGRSIIGTPKSEKIIPPVCAIGARRKSRGIFRTRQRKSVHADCCAGQQEFAHRHDRSAKTNVRY
jgi:predicted NodU family carbamoyl transferase